MAESFLSTAAETPEGAETEQPEAGAVTEGAASETTTKARPEGEVEAKEEGTQEGENKPEGAPETYEAFTMPEGVELDAEALEEFVPVAKELNLSQAAAQKLVDMYAARQGAAIEKLTAQWSTTQEQWAKDLKADPEIGGTKLTSEVRSTVAKAVDHLGGAPLREALNIAGIGNHPELVRAFYRAGKLLSEDTVLPSGATATQRRSDSEVLFPTMT